MNAPNDPRRAALSEAARRLDCPLSGDDADRLLAYLDLLQRWNATYNLTAIRDPDRMLTQHVVDCLAVIVPLRRHRASFNVHRVLDVGSGGGLPGIIIAILCPELDVTCVDTVGKKAAFIQQAAISLALRNLNARHARVEQLNDAPFDVITSRAFATLKEFLALTRPLLAPGGVWMAMKGKEPAQEFAELPSDIEAFHVEQLNVPDLAADRCLVWMRARASL
jgi:16S rRNA (guanine527-N7)-methyltransferase